MMAINVALSLPAPVRAVLAFSGAFIPPPEPWSRPPVALLHGDADPVVPVQLSLDAEKALIAAGIETHRHISHGKGHTIDDEGLDFATAFLSAKA